MPGPSQLGRLAPRKLQGILGLLARDGAQPAVDVRTFSPVPGGSSLIVPELNMTGAEAGLHLSPAWRPA